MAYNRPTLKQLRERIQADFVSRLELKGGVLQRTVVGVMSVVFAGVSHVLHGFIAWVAKQLFVWSADDIDTIVREASSWGIDRKAAEYASGGVTFAGESGATTPAGSILTRADGVQYITQADGLVEVSVKAAIAGKDGNLNAGAVLNLVAPISGVQNAATVDSGGITNGSDIEDIESLRQRILDRKQRPPMGGNINDYVQWMLQVPGVTRAWAFKHWQGLGTVGGTFVRDEDTDIFPDANEVAAVQTYVDTKIPAASEFFAFAPTPHPIAVAIRIYPNTEAVRAAVTEELEAFFHRDAEPGATIHKSRMSEAISSSTSEYYHDILTPAGDVAVETYEIATLGQVTYSDGA